jgi:hypothetical protein
MSGTSGAAGAGGTVNVLREFVMKLGYAEDESSRRKFTDGLKIMTETVATLGAAVAAAALGVIAGVRQMADAMTEVYYVSERSGGSAKTILALGSAFEDLGGTVGQARSAIEKIADAVKSEPGLKNYISDLTHQPYKNAADALQQLAEGFQAALKSGTDISVIFAEAEKVHLSHADVMVLLHKDFSQLVSAYLDMESKILGSEANVQEIAERARAFTVAYNEARTAINLFAIEFGDRLGSQLKPKIDEFKQYLVDHATSINMFIDKAADVVAAAMKAIWEFAESAGRAVGALIDWYNKLSPGGQETARIIAAIAAAMFVFNTAVGRSPVARLLALGAALVELYNDYENWKEGKESLIDWSKWAPGIESAITGIKEVATVIDDIVTKTVGWQHAAEALAAYLTLSWGVKLGAAAVSASTAFIGGLNPILLALITGGAAGVYIAHKFDEATDVRDRARAMAQQLGLEFSASPDKPGGGSYKDKSGRSYSTEELAAMYSKHHGPDSMAQAQAARDAYQFYTGKGLSPAAAAGMVAQEKAESGFDPAAVGDQGAAHGLYQWHKERRDAILAGTGIDVWSTTTTPQQQREAAWWELTHTHQRALEELKKAGDNPGVAGAAGSVYFEGPRDRNEQGAIRAQLGREYFDAFAGKATPTAATAAAPGAGTTPQTDVASMIGQPAYTPFTGFGGATNDNSATVNQTNNITVQAVNPDPDAIGKAVGEHAGQAVRNVLPNAR